MGKLSQLRFSKIHHSLGSFEFELYLDFCNQGDYVKDYNKGQKVRPHNTPKRDLEHQGIQSRQMISERAGNRIFPERLTFMIEERPCAASLCS